MAPPHSSKAHPHFASQYPLRPADRRWCDASPPVPAPPAGAAACAAPRLPPGTLHTTFSVRHNRSAASRSDQSNTGEPSQKKEYNNVALAGRALRHDCRSLQLPADDDLQDLTKFTAFHGQPQRRAEHPPRTESPAAWATAAGSAAAAAQFAHRRWVPQWQGSGVAAGTACCPLSHRNCTRRRPGSRRPLCIALSEHH